MRQFRLKQQLRVRNSHRCVRFLFDEMHRQRMTQADLSERTGVCKDTLKHWRLYTMPRISDLEAALNTLGFELYVRKVRDARD